MTGELRIPVRLMIAALADKKIKALRLLCVAKLLYNHRAHIGQLLESMDIQPKTGARLMQSIIKHGWAGTDGSHLYPRSWSRIKTSKRGGLYLIDTSMLSNLKIFEALCFAHALRALYRRVEYQRSRKGRAEPNGISLAYSAGALGLSERTCKRLRAAAQSYGFIRLYRPKLTVVGAQIHKGQLMKHLSDAPIFALGKFVVTPGNSRVEFVDWDKSGP